MLLTVCRLLKNCAVKWCRSQTPADRQGKGAGVLLKRGHAVQLQVGLRQREMLDAAVTGDQRIKAGNVGADAQRRLHESGRPAPAPPAPPVVPPAPAPGAPAPKPPTPPPGVFCTIPVLTPRKCRPPGYGGCRYRRWAGCSPRSPDRIVLQGQIDRVTQRNVELPIANEGWQKRRVSHIRLGTVAGV